MFDARYLDILDEIGWGWLLAVLFLCHNAGRVVFAKGFASDLGVAEFSAGCLEPLVRLSRSEGPTQHELVGHETSVFAAKEPDRHRLATGSLPDCLPNTALEEVDFPALWDGGLLTKRGRCGR